MAESSIVPLSAFPTAKKWEEKTFVFANAAAMVDTILMMPSKNIVIDHIVAFLETDADSSAGAVSFEIEALSGARAPGASGAVNVLAAATSIADEDVTATALVDDTATALTLATAEADRTVAANERLAINFTGTATGATNLVVTVVYRYWELFN